MHRTDGGYRAQESTQRACDAYVYEVPADGAAADAARVSILLPARNEETGLEETLASLPLDAVRALGHPVEVVVVDGNSTDRTQDVARKWGARLIVQDGRGKGNAVRNALRVLESEYVIMLDADSTYPAERVPDFVRYLDQGFDVVMGSRLRGEVEAGAMSSVNRVGNAALSLIATVLYGRRCTDVCTGQWAFRRDAVVDLPLEKDGFEIEAELYSEIVKAGLNVTEVPIQYRSRRGETKLNKFGDGARIAHTLLSCRVRGGGFRNGHAPPTATSA